MAACRDWLRTLQRASYRGVPFWVERDSISTGRRLVIHEFPHRDTPYVEDLGRKANIINVTAYVAGDDVEAQESRLRLACEVGGAGTLVLPMNRLRAHCQECEREFTKDKFGYIAFRLRFVRDGSLIPAPFMAINAIRSIEFAVSALADSLRAAFVASYRGVGVPGFVTDDAANILVEFAASVSDELRRTLTEGEDTAPVYLALEELVTDAAELVVVGSFAGRWEGRRYIQQEAIALDAPIVARVLGLMEGIGDAIPPEYASRIYKSLLTFGDDWSRVRGSTPARRQQAKNRAALKALIRAAAFAYFVRAMVQQDYPDRRTAIQARADIAEFAGFELEDMGGHESYPAFKEIMDLRGQAVQFFSELIATLAPVLIIEAPRRMPSLWWSHRLYGTADRARELTARNGTIHGMFMQTSFEALAR